MNPPEPEPVAAAAGPSAGKPVRGRLFRKYFLLVLSLVTIALLASGGTSIYFSYQENREALASLQQEKAIAAASRIEQYVQQIVQQLAFASLPQIDPSDLELRRIEFLKLLRQAPVVTDIVQIDARGCEEIFVSRLGMDLVGCQGKDRSQEPAFRNARKGKPWYGPVYFRKETEPYMTIALRASDSGPVTLGEVNLKFIWDVVSRIKVGEKGKAYVVDSNGYLVADPDIGLVLRKTDLSTLPHVRAALQSEPGGATQSTDLGGNRVLTAFAPITSLGWEVFAEQPVSEVYAKLDATILRTALLLLAGLVVSALGALALARGMTRPIATLAAGAARIGSGDLDQRIEIRTGDELESLAGQFNRMSSQLRESYAGLERKVDERTRELQNALEQQTAISEILRVISNSPTNVQPVLDAVCERAALLCDAPFARVLLAEGGRLVSAAIYHDGRLRDPRSDPTVPVPLDRTSVTGRAALDRETIHVGDVLPLADTEFAGARKNIVQFGLRAVLAVPLMREGGAYGGIFIARHAPGLFSPDQVALVQTFARQAAIAIDNVRLFNETREALDQQTAIAEILRVISRSPTDVQPVLDAVARRALELCDAAQSVIALAEGDKARFVAAYGNTASAVGETVALDRRLVAGRAILDGTVIHVQDLATESEEDYSLGREMQRRIGHHTTLAVPLMREDHAIGAIALWRMDVRPFSDKQIALVRTFADQSALAIDNVRLFNETRDALEQQRASGEVLSAISSSIADTGPVFEKILSSCEQLFTGKVGVITVVGEDRLVRLAAYHGPGLEDLSRVYPFSIDGPSATGWIVQNRKVLHFPDVEVAGDAVPAVARAGFAAMGVRAVMGAPMLWEGEGIGSIFVCRAHPGPFLDKEIALLQTFANQAVIAIQNARLFREIQDKGRQLEIANKHKSEFLANMSHELRTPLNAIIGFSEVLLERLFGDVNEKQEDYLRDIHSSGRHLLGLINDILDLSKIEAGRMELERGSFDLPQALQNAQTLVRERAQRHGITLGLEIDPALGTIVADERKLKQILLNLLSNAVKFTPDGGRVDVIARRGDGRVVISVRDTGVGIAPADQAVVFEEFRQVGNDYTRKQEGTGLGLALVRRFVELHGGTVRLESSPGHGSTFTFDIPDPS